MKPTIKKWISSSIKIAVLTVGIAFATSCVDDVLSTNERSQNERITQEAVPVDPSNPAPFSASIACADNVTNDGCNFTSGTGRDHPNQFLMVNMLNNCRTESLPPNCSWDGNVTQTKIIEVDLNNCCYPFSSLNFAMNSWKALAQSNRPASNFLITGYQRINGYMVTVYGPYRMVIQVTYRKKGLCSIVGEVRDELIAFPD